MNNPYAQVAMTYLRRPFSSWMSGVVLVAVCFLALMNMHVARQLGRQPDPASLSAKDFAMMQEVQKSFLEYESTLMQASVFAESAAFSILFMLLAIHIKGQFVDSRASLMPGFRRIHATVAGAAALIFAVLLPAALAFVLHWHPVGFVAITVLLFAAIFWVILSMSNWLIWTVLLGWFLFLSQSGTAYARELASGGRSGQAAAILAIGVLLSLLAGMRLVCLNEDMPEYRRWFRWNSAAGKLETTVPQGAGDSILDRLRQWNAEKVMAGLIGHARRASVSRWSRVCRWQVGMMTGWSLLSFCLPMVLVFYVMTCLENKRASPLPTVFAVFASVMPAMVVGIALSRRRKRLPCESLLCVNRATYLRQVGMAAALNQLQVWVSMTAVFVLWFWWMAERPISVTAAFALPISAFFQLWFFGLNVWLLRFRSPLAFCTGFVVSFQVTAMAAIVSLEEPVAAWIVLVVAAIFAVLGLVLTWDAYRRWLVTDFD
jgi:hypothetical protein